MACNTIYDFINGTQVRLPTGPHAGAEVSDDSRHGMRMLLRPDPDAIRLMTEHARLLAEAPETV